MPNESTQTQNNAALSSHANPAAIPPTHPVPQHSQSLCAPTTHKRQTSTTSTNSTTNAEDDFARHPLSPTQLQYRNRSTSSGSSALTLSRSSTNMQLLQSQLSPRPQVKHKIIRLYYCQEMTQVAHDIAKLSNGKVELCDISWNHFADGFPNLFIHKAAELKW